MDNTVLFDLSYGVYIVSTLDGERNVGCVVNSIFQVTSSPATLAISINKNNFTTDCLFTAGRFALSVLSVEAPQKLIAYFGFQSGRDADKFADTPHKQAQNGVPVPSVGVCSYIECTVRDSLDCGTHIIVTADITNTERLNRDQPMTYEYYHRVVKGKAPKNAPTYVEPASQPSPRYVCGLCNYEHPNNAEFEAADDTYRCPICGAPKSVFELR